MNKQRQIVREIASCLARAWVLLTDPKDNEHYIYVNDKWVEITIKYNGELELPHRRVDDK